MGNPRVLFLDEPTTGLDAVHANEVMAAVKALTVGGGGEGSGSDSDDDDDDEGGGGGEGGVADTNGSSRRRRASRKRQAPITVCATIHSPTPFAYSLFDSLVLLIGKEGNEEEEKKSFFKTPPKKKNSFFCPPPQKKNFQLKKRGPRRLLRHHGGRRAHPLLPAGADDARRGFSPCRWRRRVRAQAIRPPEV